MFDLWPGTSIRCGRGHKKVRERERGKLLGCTLKGTEGSQTKKMEEHRSQWKKQWYQQVKETSVFQKLPEWLELGDCLGMA